MDLFLRLGEITSVNTTLENYRPWTAYNQTYIDMFKKAGDYQTVIEFRPDIQDPYIGDDWTDDILTAKVFKGHN